MTARDPATNRWRPFTAELFHQVEHALYLALALLLCATGLLALAGAAASLWLGLADWTTSSSVFVVIDRLLVVLMLIEILHTVRVSVRSGSLTCEPFLVVGLIACIRRILVITLEVVAGDATWRSFRQRRAVVSHVDDRVGRASRADPGDGHFDLSVTKSRDGGSRRRSQRRWINLRLALRRPFARLPVAFGTATSPEPRASGIGRAAGFRASP